ncbi:hypothetical protein ARMGADRAFT_1136864 [Armillaria gallica]|uniref:Uncharacterized protein n=1 Tax=Armillaria gallica TaxID=47427 RepID=A0A2H3CKJ9_ARMGA|nr:hypothetical protein ARMGADRAFT_1136864 [Armillaria gallica]
MSADKAACCARFEGSWKVIKQKLLDYIMGEGMPKDAIEWYRRNFDCNVPRGKLNGGMFIADTAEIIKGTLLTDDQMGHRAHYAPRPALLAAIYYLLKKHFGSESYYIDILELFLETTLQMEMGQLIDLITALEDEVDLRKFSLKKSSGFQTVKIQRPIFACIYEQPGWIIRGVPVAHMKEGLMQEANNSIFRINLRVVMDLVFARMSEESKVFLGFHNSHLHDGTGPILGLVRTNGYGLEDDLKDETK